MRLQSAVNLICLAITVIVIAMVSPLHAQLRVVSYNTLNRPSQSSDFPAWNVVLDALGAQNVNGITQRIGIMGLQEVEISGSNAQNIATLLNNLYDVSSYQATSAPYGDGFNLQSFVYDSSQVDLLGTSVFPVGTRPGWRGQFRPVGYDSPEAEFYVYSVHLKAFPGFETLRGNEALALRNNGNALGPDANIIYAGDFNLTSGVSEPAYANMLASGNGQAVDPEGGDFTDPLKKSYSSTGANSRIDFQFISTELEDDEGLDLIDSSYRVFGREQVGSRIITSPTELISASDHLPVVADYQLPAVMDAFVSSVPATLTQGEIYNLDLTVSNAAPVLTALGADELDYSLNTTGNIGSFLGATTGTVLALTGGNLHQLALDTSTLGPKNGAILVSSSSPGEANGLLSIDVTYNVLAIPEPDAWLMVSTLLAMFSSHWRRAGSRS